MSARPTILVVDDISSSLELLVKVLTPAGYQVHPADSGELALAAVKANRPDLILLDIHMKDIGGFKVCQKLKADELTRDIPIIFISATSGVLEAVEGLKLGAVDYISKPFLPEELLIRVKTHIDLAHANLALKQQAIELQHANLQLQTEIAQRKQVEIDLRQSLNRAARSRQVVLSALEDKKKSESALRKSEELFRKSQQAASIGSYKTSFANNTRELSDVLYKILGTKKEDHKSVEGWLELVHPEDREMWTQYFTEKVVKKQLPFDLEYRIIRKSDGEVRWIHGLGEVDFDSEGNLQTMIGTIQDITARKIAEEAFQASELRYRSIFEGAVEGILIADLATKTFRYANPAICSMLQYSERELVGMSVSDIHPKDSLNKVISEFEAQARGEKTLAPDLPCRRKDGSVIFVDISTSSVIMDGIACNVGFFTDISERKSAEEALKSGNERLRMTVKAGNIGLWDWDFKTNEVNFSPEWKSQIGYQDHEFEGNYDSWESHLHPDDIENTLKQLSSSLEKPYPPYSVEFRLLHKNGSYRWILASGEVQFDETGQSVGMIGTHTDITEHKLVEEELKIQKAYLEELFESAPEAITILDNEDRIQRVNREFTTLFGYSTSEAIGYKINDLIVPIELKDEGLKVTTDVAVGKSIAIETIRQKKNGEKINVSILGYPIKIGKNQLAVYGIYRDITERKRAEDALRKNKAQLSNALQMAQLGPWEYDVLKDLFTFNDQFYAIFRTTADQVGGYSMSSAEYAKRFLHPDDAVVVGEEVRKAIETTDPNFNRMLEHRIIYSDGEVGYITVRFFVVMGEQGKTIRTYGVNQDITKRKRNEIALQETMERLKGFDQHSTEGIYRIDMLKPVPVDLSRTEIIKRIDEHAIIGEVNDSLARMYGLAPKEMIGRKVIEFAPHYGERAFLVLGKEDYRVKNEETEDVDNDGNTIYLIENYHGIVKDGNLHAIWGAQSNITERKRAEEAVRESEERYRNLIEGSYDLVQSVSPDGKFSLVNKAWLDALGYSQEEIENISAFDVIHPDFVPHCREIFERVLTGEPIKNFETTFITKNGKTILLEGNAVPRIKGDKIIGTQGFYRDITDRRRSEQDLKKWGHIFENTQLGIGVSDTNGNKIEMSNPAYEKLVGYTSLELKMMPISDLFPQEHHEDLEKQIDIINMNGLGSFESIIKCKDGSTFPAQIDANSVKDDKGNFMYRVVNLQDITKRKRAEEKLNEYSTSLERMVYARTNELDKARRHAEDSRDRIDTILKSVSDGLVVTNLENKIVLLNSTAESLLGVRMADAIDNPIDFAIKNKTLRERLKSAFHKNISEYEFDFELPDINNGNVQIINARTSAIFDKQNKKAGMVTILHDVTVDREVDRMKTEFVSTAAHELRTPLTSIQGFSEVLIIRDDLSVEEKLRFLTYINTQSINLGVIINDLLDISRIEDGKGFELNRQPVDIIKCIHEIVDLFRDRSSKHRFRAYLPKKEIILLLDNDKILQVFENLLSNATKYSPDGGEIQIRGKVEDDQFKVSIKDQGIGMTPDQIERVYEKFYRADASNTAFEGTGLGMTIVKHIIEAHGGTVWAESEINKGTVFGIGLPLIKKGKQINN